MINFPKDETKQDSKSGYISFFKKKTSLFHVSRVAMINRVVCEH